MNDGLVSKLKKKWCRFVWDYLINDKSSLLFKKCSKELEEVYNDIMRGF